MSAMKAAELSIKIQLSKIEFEMSQLKLQVYKHWKKTDFKLMNLILDIACINMQITNKIKM